MCESALTHQKSEGVKCTAVEAESIEMDVATLEDIPLQCLETSSIDHPLSRPHILKQQTPSTASLCTVEMSSNLVSLTGISIYEANQRWRGFRRVHGIAKNGY